MFITNDEKNITDQYSCLYSVHILGFPYIYQKDSFHCEIEGRALQLINITIE